MPKHERPPGYTAMLPRTDEQIAREASLKTWSRPKVYRRVRPQYCVECGCVHDRGKHKREVGRGGK